MTEVIETAGSIVNQNFTLIKNYQKYLVPNAILKRYLSNSEHDTEFLKLLYRRLIRLAPFVSNLQRGREMYIDYVKYKFKYEDYELKRRLVLGDVYVQCAPRGDNCWKSEALNTLNFIIRAVSYVENGGGTTTSKREANSSRLARVILRNLLTVEYDKLNGQKSSRENTAFYEYRISFDHLKAYSLPIKTLKKKLKESGGARIKDTDFVKYKAVASFDRCIVYLNESLNTRL